MRNSLSYGPNCTGVIEDEHHALFDCPVYDDLMENVSDLFHDDCRTLVKLFSFDQDYAKAPRFLTLCRERRVQRSVESHSLMACVAPKDYKM
jgi:hypothetical protein